MAANKITDSVVANRNISRWLGSAVIGGERLNLVGAARKVANDKDQDKQRTGAEQGRVVQHNISCTVADALRWPACSQVNELSEMLLLVVKRG